MEFEEMQKIWNTQNNQPLYAVDMNTIHNSIIRKKKQGYHITNVSELLLIIVHIGSGSLVLVMEFIKRNGNIFMYLLSAWMFIVACYCLISRARRISGEKRFDRSMFGDLKYAISTATYQVRLSQLMRWNIVPISILTILGILDSRKFIWIAALILPFIILIHYASRWEHNLYKRKKRELERLLKKLEDDQIIEEQIT